MQMTVTQICTSHADGKVTPMSNDKWLKCMEVMWTVTWLSLRTQVICHEDDKVTPMSNEKVAKLYASNTNDEETITDNKGDDMSCRWQSDSNVYK